MNKQQLKVLIFFQIYLQIKKNQQRKINYQYYIKEAYKIINALSAKQLSL